MASGEEAERTVRRVYEAMGEGGSPAELMERLTPLLTPDAEWVNPEDAIERGTRVGAEGWLTALENTQSGLGSNVTFQIEDLTVLGEDTVFVRATPRAGGTSSGVEVEGRMMGMYWTVEDRRVRRFEWSFDVDELLARARSEAST
jgi:ketosteroid isomerase-like protein